MAIVLTLFFHGDGLRLSLIALCLNLRSGGGLASNLCYGPCDGPCDGPLRTDRASGLTIDRHFKSLTR